MSNERCLLLLEVKVTMITQVRRAATVSEIEIEVKLPRITVTFV